MGSVGVTGHMAQRPLSHTHTHNGRLPSSHTSLEKVAKWLNVNVGTTAVM